MVRAATPMKENPEASVVRKVVTIGFTRVERGRRMRSAITIAPTVSLARLIQGMLVPIWLMQPEMRPMIAASWSLGRTIRIDRQ